MKPLIVIPARWGSLRLPGKPLAMIAGHTLLQRSIDLAVRASRRFGSTDIVVATDDERIADHARDQGCAALITSGQIDSGSARALVAARQWTPTPRHVVNLQGDAPFLPAEAICDLLSKLVEDCSCVTAVVPHTWKSLDALRLHKRESPTSGTTCICGHDGRARWFSKEIIPFLRYEATMRRDGLPCPILQHLGIYGYRLSTLEQFESAPLSAYEELEGLEQLRLLEMGITIDTITATRTAFSLGGIDTQVDVDRAEQVLARHGDPYGT